MHGIVQVSHEKRGLSLSGETRERSDDALSFVDAGRMACGTLVGMPLVGEMRGRHEQRAVVRFEPQSHPEQTPLAELQPDILGAVLDLFEHRAAPVDVAFARPAGEAVLHATVCGHRTIDRIARRAHQLLQAQHVRVEYFEELQECRFTQPPALCAPDVVRDEAQTCRKHLGERSAQ
jgi:hypothetical protein